MENNTQTKLEKKERLLNIRPLFCAFVSIIIGIFSSYLLFQGKTFLHIALIVTLSLLLITFVFSFTKFNRIEFLKKQKFLILIIIISTIIGQVISYCSINSLTYRPVANGEYVYGGLIKSVNTSNKTTEFIIENVKIENKQYNFNVKVYLFNGEQNDFTKVGNEIYVQGKLSVLDLFSNGKINTSVSNSKIYYSGTVNSIESYLAYGTTLLQKFKHNIENTLHNNLDEDIADLSYAILMGDKYELSSNIYDIFKNSGLAHVLAVSGLHVGLIVAFLLFLLKKLKVKPIYILLILTFILTVYCIICEFSASVLRASIMAVVYLIADCFGKRKDMLSTFSASGLIILLIFPMQLFSVGFLLSFGAVFGIIFLANPINNLLQKIKLPKKLCSLISVSLSATISTLPIISAFFGYIAASTLISNIFLLPMFTFAYYLLFISTLVGLIFPLNILFYATNFLFNVIISFGFVFSKLGVINIKNFGIIASIIYYLIVVIISNYINAKKENKALISILLLLPIIINTFIVNSNHNYNEFNLIFNKNIENSYVLTTETNSHYLIGVGNGDNDDWEYQQISNLLNYRRIFNIDAIILPEYKSNSQQVLINIVKNYNVKQILITNKISELNLGGLEFFVETPILTVNFNENYKIEENVIINAHVFNNTHFAFGLKIYNKETIVAYKTLTNNRIDYLNNYNYCKLICENSKNTESVNKKDDLLIKNNINIGIFNDIMLKLSS